MKLISWNVNGLRACVQKGFLDIFKELDADMFCIQESNSRKADQLELEGYHQYWNYAKKKVIRDSNIYQAGTNQRKIRTWNRGARPGRACDHIGV